MRIKRKLRVITAPQHINSCMDRFAGLLMTKKPFNGDWTYRVPPKPTMFVNLYGHLPHPCTQQLA